MKKFAILVLLGLFVPGACLGAEIFEKVGTVGGQFLKLGVGARAAGMGGAYVSVADDATAVFWNPAGIARITGNVVSVNHLVLPADVAFDQAAYVFSLGFLPGTLAIHARALTMDDMPRTTVFHPYGDGTFFDAGDMAFGLSYGRSLTDKFSVGATANIVKSGLDEYSSQSNTIDFGTIYDTGFRSIRIGMCISNAGSEMKFIEKGVKMPIVFRVGMSMNVYQNGPHSLLSAGEFSHPPDNAERANWGVEYAFQDFFFARTGYNFNYDSDKFAFGAGFKFPVSSAAVARLDYAFTDWGSLGGLHRVSMELNF
ncbi:MAG: PorV/PorQ family protein [Candidatus Eisenbacteria bacterium]